MNPNTENEFLEILRSNTILVKKVCCMYSENAHDKQDLEQEICLQLWRAYPGFKGNSKVSTWLYRVALNTAITFFKKQKRKNSENEVCKEFYDLTSSTDDEAQAEKLTEMRKAINMLSKVEKALVMLYIDEKPYDEIADILGISAVNARVRLTRIKDKLRKTVKN